MLLILRNRLAGMEAGGGGDGGGGGGGDPDDPGGSRAGEAGGDRLSEAGGAGDGEATPVVEMRRVVALAAGEQAMSQSYHEIFDTQWFKHSLEVGKEEGGSEEEGGRGEGSEESGGSGGTETGVLVEAMAAGGQVGLPAKCTVHIM